MKKFVVILRITLVVLLLTVLYGCPVDRNGSGTIEYACLGDSRTNLGVYYAPSYPLWCDVMQTEMPTVLATVSGSTTAIMMPTSWTNLGMPGTMVTQPAPTYAYPKWAYLQYQDARIFADVVVAEFGANDILQHRTPQQIVDGYRALVDEAAMDGVTVYVATITPFRTALTFTDIIPPYVDEVNALIRQNFANVVDLDTGFGPEDYVFDGIHLSTIGQQKYAKRVKEALTGARN